MQSCVLDALADDQDAKVKFVTCQMDWNAEYTGQNVCRPQLFRRRTFSSCLSNFGE